jgi:hypothetical protein
MGDLERVLPDELMRAAVSSGEELLLPYSEALKAIAIASANQIAILGVELFEVKAGWFQALGCSDYKFLLAGPWSGFVAVNNVEAERCIREHSLSQNQGYILTSTSQREFASLD